MSDFLNQYLAQRNGATENPQKNALKNSISQALERNPDDIAEVVSLAEKTKLSPVFVERHKKKVQSLTIDYDKIQRESPVLAAYLSNKKNAAISHDDIGVLEHIEGTLRSLPAGFIDNFGMAFEGSARALDAGGRMLARGLDAALPESADKYIWNQEDSPEWLKALNKIDPAAAIRWQGQGLKQNAAAIRPQNQTIASDIAGAVGQLGGQILTAIMAPQALVPSLFAAGVDQQGERQEASGTEGESVTSDLALLTGGAITAASEKVGIDALLKRVPPKIKNRLGQQLADVVLAGGAEAVQEVTENIAQGLLEQLTTNPDAEIFEGLEREAIVAGGAGAIVRGLVNLATPGRARAQSHEEIIQTLADDATKSKVQTRSPELFQQHVEALSREYGTIDSVYLDAKEARTLFQGMKSDDAKSIIEKQIDEAEAIGGDIVIPLPEFMAKVAASEDFSLLKPHLRLTPEKTGESDFKSSIDDLLNEADRNAKIKQRADEIYRDIESQLSATGRMDANAAKYSAQVIPAYVATRAARSGMTPEQVYEMMGLEVVGPDVAATGSRILKQDEPRKLSGDGDVEGLVTGEAVTFNYLHNKDSATKIFGIPDKNSPYGRGYEPSGRYVTVVSDAQEGNGDQFESGTITLKNPLIIPNNNLKWKKDLSDKHDGKTGKELSKAVIADGYDGIITTDLDGISEVVEFHSFDEAKALFQEGGDKNKPIPRGLISLAPQRNIIKLTEASDLSTFLHEAGHLFLEMEGRLFANPNATEDIKKDGQKILDWLGAESFEKITADQHEKWARGFEKYLGEGKAPSVELQSAFRRFAAWMRQVYRSLTRLNVELTDDIREVMDRMLATDQQINRVKSNFNPLFTSAEDAGMTKPEYEAYRAQGAEDAKETLMASLIKELERQQKQWWKDELAITKAEVKKELSAQQEYKAEAFIKKGEWIDDGDTPFDTFKINKAEVKELYGKIPTRLRGMTSDEGMDIDVAGQMFGFASGRDMLDAIESAEPLQKATSRIAEERMLTKHGDAMSDGTLREKAEKAVHNLEQGKRLLAELKGLSRKTGNPAPDREAMKAFAAKKISQMRYQDIKPSRYLAAEKRAGKEAVIAKERGDLETAQQEKVKELVNFYLWKEASEQRDRGEKMRAFLKSVQARDYKNAKIDKEYASKAKQLVAAFNFRKGVKDSEELALARIEAVKNWIESQQQDPENNAAFVEAEVLGKLIPQSEMTVSDLTGLNDVVKSILHAGRRLAEIDKEEYRKNIEAGVASLKANRIETYSDDSERTPWVKAKTFLNEGAAMLRKMESLAREADGMNEQGWMWKNTIKPLLDAANNALRMKVQSGEEMNDLFKGYSGVFNTMKGRQTFTLDSGEKFTLSKGGRIAFALNMGNSGNMEALLTMKSLPLTQNDVQKIAASLSDAEWDLVQNVWDYVDTYWPQVAELELKRSGIAPEKVKGLLFTTPSGKKMRGGYYPLAGDPGFDLTQADQDVAQQAELMKQGGTARKTTKHGSTIERVGFGGKRIDFSIDVLFNHIDGIIHDVTHWEAIKDVDRVLRNSAVQDELKVSLGTAGVAAFKQRLLEVAAGPQKLNGINAINRILRHARVAATYGALGYSVRTAMMNTLGLTTAIADMDAKTVAAGTAAFYKNPDKWTSFINERSTYMQERGKVINRDIAYIRSHLRGDGFFTKFKDHSFWLMTQTDKAITRPIWVAAYQKGETMFDTEAEVIDYADRMVARTQSSGFDMDLSSVENKNELVRQFTVMYSAFSAIYNIMTEQVKRKKIGKISTLELTAKMSWLLIVPAILEKLLTGGSDEEEPAEIAADYAGSVLNYGLGTIPVVREVASARKYGQAFPSPLMQMGLAPFELGDQIEQGELDKGLLRAMGSTASMFHIPGGAQSTRTIGYLIDLMEGDVESFSPYELIVTGQDK